MMHGMAKKKKKRQQEKTQAFEVTGFRSSRWQRVELG